MTPGFALSLSHEGIALLEQADSAWRRVGDVRLEDPDLTGSLAALRNEARARAGDAPFATKLILPNSQILYARVEAVGASDIADSEQVADTLDGATPYALSDLVYDWVRQGDHLYIAAVARETLDEAEDFAAEHRFNPVCFVAAPEEGEFPGEPWFGETAMALEVLPEGASIDRDGDTVRMSDWQVPDTDVDLAPATDQAGEQPVPEPASIDPEPDASDAPVFMSIRGTPPSAKDAEAETLPASAPAAHATGEPAADAVPAAAAMPSPPVVPAARMTPSSGDRTIIVRAAPTASDRVLPRAEPPLAAPARTVTPPASPADREELTEEEALTVFGARHQKARPAAPARRLWLAAGIAVLVLAGAAAFWVGGPDATDGTAPEIARTDPGASAPLAPDVATGVDVAATSESLVAPAPTPPVVTDASTIGIQPEPVAGENSAPTEQIDIQSARTAYAATGIWQRAPDPGYVPPADEVSDLYIASIDPAIPNQDAFALPDNETSGDSRPRVPPVPRHPDETVEYDADGLVVPTDSGTLSPGGVRIYSGEPFIVPPTRPLSLQPDAAPIPGGADDPLSEYRPRQRPEGLVESNEKAVLGGRTLAELGQFRPQARPVSLQETAQILEDVQRQTDAELVDDAVEDAVAAALAADLASATRLAVAASPDPRNRPSNIAQLADRARRLSQEQERRRAIAEAAADAQARDAAQQRALAAATQAEEEKLQAAEARAAAEKKQEEAAKAAAAASTASRSNSNAAAVSRSQRLKVSTSTPASVARQATLKNAISLNKVALIGVYGASSQRRALVRLPSGKYVKVQVGDRIDGGQVASIGQSDLRYTKSGRSVTITMPKG